SSSSCGRIASRERRWRSLLSRPAERPEARPDPKGWIRHGRTGHKLTARPPRLRKATKLDLPRISEVRHGTAENRLEDPSLVTPAEVDWYLNEAIFLVSEDDAEIQGFACANHQTGYVWALFVIDGA